MWNHFGVSDDEDVTNNGLERYVKRDTNCEPDFILKYRHNRELNDRFPTAHPSLLQFVATIEEMSREKACILEDVRKQNYIVPKRKVQSRKIPISYKRFNPE